MASTQKLLKSDDQADASSTPRTVASLLSDTDPARTLPPPTKAQVYYWRELCGVVNAAGKGGLVDEDWPAELAPSHFTLKALQERKLLVRRGRAWHLRRQWFTRLAVLRERAVPTPPLALAEHPAEGLPTYAELERWEQVCRWLDAQPHRRARLPFTGILEIRPERLSDELPLAELKGMRRYRLVRHTAVCAWALSPTWKDRLMDLWQGVDKRLREIGPEADAASDPPLQPRVVAAGLDTWYLNWLVDEALPAGLRTALDTLQECAREEETEMDTPWLYDGARLQLYRYGTSAAQGGGVSWSYILRNPSLTLLIRKAPLGRVIAQARLGSECLWRLTPRRALDELDRLLSLLWLGSNRSGRLVGKGKTLGQWQVSQAHLAVDVTNFPLTEELPNRVVSRSRKRALYAAAQRDVETLLAELADQTGLQAAQDDPYPLLIDWDQQFADDQAFGWGSVFSEEMLGATNSAAQDWETPAEERSQTLHSYGKRYSGISWSLGGAISLVLYDKTLQARLTNKRHMEPIWQANGRQPDERVTRCEGRLRREALHDLRLPGEAGEARPCLDDPWQFLDHQQDVFAALVGQPLEDCPDAVNVAWLRLIVPPTPPASTAQDAGEDKRLPTGDQGAHQDTNRSRWPTDPAWQVIQQAQFTIAPQQARRLIRRRQQAADIRVLDRLEYGALVSRVAKLHPHGGQYDISAAIGEAVPALMREAAHPKKDFGALVRERRRQWGLPLPIADKLLPFRFPQPLPADARGHTEHLDTELALDASPDEQAYYWLAQAERRMLEADRIRQDAERGDAHRSLIRQAQEDAARAGEAYAAALVRIEQATGTPRIINAAQADRETCLYPIPPKSS